MNKEAFFQLFNSVLDQAAQEAEKKLGHAIPRQFEIHLHGAGYASLVTDVQTCVDLLFIDEYTFYQVIDVSVIEVDDNKSVCFVRASGHHPVPFKQTWNNPMGQGPFNLMVAKQIIDNSKRS